MQKLIEKMVEASGYSKPFTKNGKPAKYLGLIVPFLYLHRVKREDCLKAMNIDPATKPSSFYSSYFNKYEKAEIFEYDKKGRYWSKGRNFDLFMYYVVTKMSEHETPRGYLRDAMTTYGTNALDFIIRGNAHAIT